MLWVLLTIVSHPSVVADLGLNKFRATLLVGTLTYNFLVAIVATLLALCPAIVIGRGRGKSATFLLVTLPAVLFMPFLALEYGWLQCVRMLRPAIHSLGWSLEPGGWLDVARCIWSLSAWLWVVPAFIIGMSLRQIDPAIQECALLDGDTFRITLRQLSGPIVASIAVVTILATQEYAVYEPTGINVVATEVRMVFSTGAFSSLPDQSNGGESAPLTQSERAAASVTTAAPLMLVTLILARICHALGASFVCRGNLARWNLVAKIGRTQLDSCPGIFRLDGVHRGAATCVTRIDPNDTIE